MGRERDGDGGDKLIIAEKLLPSTSIDFNQIMTL